MNEIIEETFLANKDIRELRSCSSGTASAIMKKIKEKYEIDEDLLPHSRCVPLSLYEDMFRKRSKNDWKKKKDA